MYTLGKKVVEENFDDPGLTLLSFLRRRLGLCGTKLGCGEGGCGACTVMVSDLQVHVCLNNLKSCQMHINRKGIIDNQLEMIFIQGMPSTIFMVTK